MLIGELADALGVTRKTLRHYEEIGLVLPAERAHNGYRTYPLQAVRRAQLVVGFRAMGLSIDQIRTLFVEDGRTLRQRLLGLLDEQIQEYALEIAVLQGRHNDLEARYHALVATRASRNGDCVCSALMRPCDCSVARAMPPRGDRRKAS
jgi:DNA-binding transcriptional MerR regulator